MLAWGLGSGCRRARLARRRSSPRSGASEAVARRARRAARRSSTRARAPARRRRVLAAEIPLTLHARYSRQEIVAALGYGEGVKPKVTQGGILWVPRRERRVLRRPAQGRARLLADDDVPRLRDQPRALPLGVAVPPDAASSRRSSATSTTASGAPASCCSCGSARRSSSEPQPFHVPRPGRLRRPPRRAARRVHVAAARAHAGSAVRGRTKRRGGLTALRPRCLPRPEQSVRARQPVEVLGCPLARPSFVSPAKSHPRRNR